MSINLNANHSDYSIINTPQRHAFQQKSVIYRHGHPDEKKRLDQELEEKIYDYFNGKFQIHDLNQTKRIFNFILDNRKIRWEKEKDLSYATFNQIDQAFEESLVCCEEGVSCSFSGSPEVAAIFEIFFTQETEFDTSLISWKKIKSLLFVKDPFLLQETWSQCQSVLLQSFKSFEAGKIKEEVFTAFIFQVLSLSAFFYPEEGGKLQLPVKTNGSWGLKEYRVDQKFEMSPSWFSSPLPIFGFLSDDCEAPPILTCIGTTYPAGDGFMAAFLSDCTPGMSVGHAASLYGKKSIERWLEDKSNVIVAGVSLGGALALHTARLHLEKISHVYAFNPAGLYPWNWLKVNHSSTQFKIYYQENDLVATMGMFPEGDNVNIYRLFSHKTENFLAAHTKVYSAAKKVMMLKTHPKNENRRIKRIALTYLHLIFSPLIALIVLPFHLLYRLCEILYRLISRFCYALSSMSMEDRDEQPELL